MTRLVIPMALAVIACADAGQGQETIVYEPAAMRADLERFHEALVALHPGSHTHQSPSDLERLVVRLQQAASVPMNDEAFYRLVLRLVASVHDGHTQAFTFGTLRERKGRQTRLPFDVFVRDERIFITRHYGSASIKSGSELLAVDDRLSSRILSALHEHYSADGLSRNGMDHWLGGPYRPFRRLYADVFGADDRYSVTYRDVDTRSVRTVLVSGITDEGYQREAGQDGESADAFTFDLRGEDGYALMRITRFFKDGFDEPENTFPDMYAAAFRDLSDLGVRKLIVDLRGNGGGKASNAAYLLQYFIDRPLKPARSITALNDDDGFRTWVDDDLGLDIAFGLEPTADGRFQVGRGDVLRDLMVYDPAERFRFDGTLVVLIDGGTTSAGAIAAGLLREHAGAILVGEETFGYAGISNGVRSVRVRGTLTETGVNIPLLHAEYELPSAVARRSVVPDYQVSPTVYDLQSGNDPVLDFVQTLFARPEGG